MGNQGSGTRVPGHGLWEEDPSGVYFVVSVQMLTEGDMELAPLRAGQWGVAGVTAPPLSQQSDPPSSHQGRQEGGGAV